MKTIRTIPSVMAVLLLSLTACSQSADKKENVASELAMSTIQPSEKETMKKTGAFLEISLKINDDNRPAAAGVYLKYKEPFLTKIDGATSKELLMRGEDVQVLHGFETEEQANAYLTTSLFSKDIVGELGPLLAADPEVRVYSSAAAIPGAQVQAGAFLEISLKIDNANRPAAGEVYAKYKAPFLEKADGATSKELLMRGDDVQVLHGFETEEQANAYLTSDLFTNDVVRELGPLLGGDPEIRVYSVFKK